MHSYGARQIVTSAIRQGASRALFCAVLFSAWASQAQTPGFTTAMPMTAGRTLHTATLLPNGKVLVAGGSNGSISINSAELYDPASNTWSGLPSMMFARGRHTATLLPNGKVLIAAGSNVNGGAETVLKSAEIFDPATNT